MGLGKYGPYFVDDYFDIFVVNSKKSIKLFDGRSSYRVLLLLA